MCVGGFIQTVVYLPLGPKEKAEMWSTCSLLLHSHLSNFEISSHSLMHVLSGSGI